MPTNDTTPVTIAGADSGHSADLTERLRASMTPTERAVWSLWDTINTGNLERVRELVTNDFVDHGAPPGLIPSGPDGYIAILRFLTSVLRIRYELHDVFAAEDRVAVRATVHGVHDSDFLGVPPTGKPYAMSTIHIYRGEGDRLAEHWGVRDELGVLRHVGAVAAPSLPLAPTGQPSDASEGQRSADPPQARHESRLWPG
jgi:predicted ester cyclase